MASMYRTVLLTLAVVFPLCAVEGGISPTRLRAAPETEPVSFPGTVAPQSSGTLEPWRLTNSMPSPRQDLAAVATGSHIYVLGGLGDNSTLNSVIRTAVQPDGSLGPWKFTASMTHARRRFSAVIAKGYVRHGR